ncbi:hypothetical protein ACP2AV_04620 [Aliiroseovarius sp. PTFE2010]|uniref:hypothetical protein n=1 Tax=Aliiroseovarius sp. PTFE2010 TaxID=3417190 RepID=UPI003CF90DCA
MPKLVSMYIRHVLIGFGLSSIFVAALLWINVANLRHLIFTSDVGILALILLVVFNGIVFSGVQFAIAIMNLAEKEPPKAGPKPPVMTSEPAMVRVHAGKEQAPKRL